METKENLKERLKHQVMERMDISRTMEDEEILELVQKTLEEDSHRMPMSISMRQNLIREIFHSLRRLDILQDLIEDADITEIMVNGTKGIFYEKAGRLYQWDKHFTSEEKLQDVIQQIAGGSNRMVNELHPIVDTRLPDGSRVNIVLKPIAIDGTALSIRRLEQWVNGINNIYMKDIHNWCRIHFVKYHTVFVYRKEYPVKANIWNGYSYIRWRMERMMNLG